MNFRDERVAVHSEAVVEIRQSPRPEGQPRGREGRERVGAEGIMPLFLAQFFHTKGR